ncbi:MULTISPECIES: hypothetical protein [Gimesia]|uniref:Uncharacterized protein n=2 Tax=Gimesia TaxID=1649453 RepID=A0A517VER7_9PLAN|nr:MULTISPECIES: hypothetical protein [Gimesia]QDT91504.1 hypothetical protein Pan161_31620 [Gimesia algae]QDV48382.1 hypothetical protein Enr17x_03940 [Gimesia fumaroli]
MKFNGFEHLTANFLYCPNQFFDVCLPHHSRGTVRLVAYMLRKILGWLDAEGNPIEQNIGLSYHDLIHEAGISRGAIRSALDEAVAGGFIACLQPGRANGHNQTAETAHYRLRWATDGHYEKTPETFNGFFAGEGNRTPIPNSFFDLIVRQETLAVVKVVGTVLRHTVGYQNQFGGRRQVAPLSYSYIQKYAGLSDRSTLSAAIQHAIETGYIHCVEKGSVNPSSNQRRPSTYAIRWHQQAHSEVHGTKSRPAGAGQFKNQTSNGSETPPAERFKNQTQEKTPENNTDKQQEISAVAVFEKLDSVQLLRNAGFDEVIARELAEGRGPDEIQKQINWLAQRNPKQNRLGLLRKAIEENWASPVTETSKQKKKFHAQEEQTELEATEADKKRRQVREKQLVQWKSLSADQKRTLYNQAIQLEQNSIIRARLVRCQDELKPVFEVLRLLESSQDQSTEAAA